MRIPLILYCLVLLFLGLSFGGREDSPFHFHVPLGLDEYVPVPEDNLLTGGKIELGKQLFFDKRLSRDSTIACASCHLPERVFANETRVAVGIKGQHGTRNVPSILNRAYGNSHFWDGRAKSLEEQALDPIQNPKEMDMSLIELEKRLMEDREYQEDFERAFSSKPTAHNAAKAIATFVRTLLSGNSAFDRFEHGDASALSEPAKRGLQIFRGKGNCIACHVGPTFTDEKFHNTGIAFLDTTLPDWGRYTVTKIEKEKGAFKTPTLRNISLTAPYMHNGVFASLEDVVEFYDKGGILNTYLDEEIHQLKLTKEEKEDLIEFLRSLRGEAPESMIPKR